jgi:PAS domain S-box-containing protein
VLRTIHDGVAVVNESGKMILFNPAAERIVGRAIVDSPPEVWPEMYGLFRLDGHTPFPHDELPLVRALKGEEVVGAELLIRQPGQNEGTWVSVYAHPLLDASGEQSGAVSIFRDVTARRRAEQALKDSEARYHTLVESLPLATWCKDRDGKFVFANERFCKSLGQPLSRILGADDFAFFPKELAEKYRRDDNDVMESRNVIEDVEEYQGTDGGRLYVQVLKAPLYDSRREVIGTQGIFWDVTARKAAERALAESREHYRLVLATANDAFITMDARGVITEWNEQAEAVFGWSRQEVLGRTLSDTIVPVAHRAAHNRGLARYRTTQEGPILNRRIEITALHRSGNVFPVELTVWPVRVGETTQFNAFIHDITARKQAEAQLQAAKSAAESASHAKSVFLANMSHEIRTPMNGIIGLTELLLKSELSPEQREYLELIHVSAESLLTVINDILDFSKVEAGKLELDRIEFSLRDKMGDTMKSLALRAHSKGLELACHIPTSVPDALVGDPGRFRQVLVNLVGNAIKFTDKGEVVVRVRTHTRTPESVLLEVAVSDTGMGIPPEKKSAVFAPFEQADSSTTRKHGGTGLGLAISSRLVELMGGKIWLESEPGKGSTFSFLARFAIGVERPESPTVRDAARLEGLRVLVIDDHPTNRLILGEMLGHWRMEPTLADGARSALSSLDAGRLSGKPFGLVLCDLNMPEIDGYDFARLLRARDLASAPPIIILSSGGAAANGEEWKRLGIAASLMKPVKQSELFDLIVQTIGVPAEALAGQPAREPAQTTALSILLAEDNVVNQKLAVRLLENRGHRITVVFNGKDAVEAVARGGWDVVLMDVQMPQMDGLEATAAIRRTEAETGGHVPIIAMTAHAMKGDRERCLAAGMDGYVSKPIRAVELYAAVESAKKPRPTPESAEPTQPAGPQLVDWVGAMETVDGDISLFREMVEAFMEDCPKLLADVRDAIQAGDGPRCRRAAHTLKGAAGHLGARAAQERAQALETLAASGNLADAVQLVGLLENELVRLGPALKALANEPR